MKPAYQTLLTTSIFTLALGCQPASKDQGPQPDPAKHQQAFEAGETSVQSTQESPNRVSPGASLATFERAVAGFPRCDLPGLYIDAATDKPAHAFLVENKLTPCRITEELAIYCVTEQFHGLRVTQLAVPRSTTPVFALYFDNSLDEARRTMQHEFGSEFRPSQESRDGIVPELLADPEHAGRSVLICTKEF